MDTVAHVGLVSVFLSVFYFVYVDQVEGEIVEDTMDRVVDDIVDQASAIEGEPIVDNPDFRRAVLSIEMPDTSAEDAEVKRSNAKVRRNAFLMLAAVMAAMLVAVATLWWVGRRRNPSAYDSRALKWLAVSNAHLLMSAAITEFLFLVVVARNFRVLGAGWVEKQLTSNVIAYVVGRLETRSMHKQIEAQLRSIVPKVLDSVEKAGGDGQGSDSLRATLLKSKPVIEAVGRVTSLSKTNDVYNRWLWTSTGIVSGTLAAVFIVVALVISLTCEQRANACHAAVTGVSTILLVAIVEFLFFKLVAQQYIPTTPSTLVSAIVSKLRVRCGAPPLKKVSSKRKLLVGSTIGVGVLFAAGLAATTYAVVSFGKSGGIVRPQGPTRFNAS